MPAVLVTGFTGFLGSALVAHLLDRYPADTTIACLVQSRFREVAQRKRDEIGRTRPGAGERIQFIDGDITCPTLGEGLDRLKSEMREIYHLAAVYDHGVQRGLAMRVNVDGTRHVLRYAKECPQLNRFHYVSTCYVSGRYDGVFSEDDLEKGQTFNNYYEESKFWAEADVQQAMHAGLPATIYRPAIVVGDSVSGITQKFDGPYYLLKWILRWPHAAPVPFPEGASQVEFNVVPRDFVIKAIEYLGDLEVSRGKIYHLSDPLPPTIAEVYEILAHVSERRLIRTPMRPNMLKTTLNRLKPLRTWTGLEPAVVDYLTHPSRYTAVNTICDLEGSGITCPPFASYADRLVSYFRMHPEINAATMA